MIVNMPVIKKTQKQTKQNVNESAEKKPNMYLILKNVSYWLPLTSLFYMTANQDVPDHNQVS